MAENRKGNVMGYAVELYFDSQSEKRVWELRQLLVDQGIASTTTQLGDRPHVSLAVFQNVDHDDLILVTKEYTKEIRSFDFSLSAIGSFSTNENVVFLSPIPTRQLLDCHRYFHHQLSKAKLIPSAYYIPGNWTPHCTVDMNIRDEQYPKALEICARNFKPIEGQIREIGVTEFRPIKRLANWVLADNLDS